VQLPPSSVTKLAWPRLRSTAWPVPEAVVTILCTPYDGCGWHPKHVEWTCRIINRLLCVASRWTIINTFVACVGVLTVSILSLAIFGHKFSFTKTINNTFRIHHKLLNKFYWRVPRYLECCVLHHGLQCLKPCYNTTDACFNSVASLWRCTCHIKQAYVHVAWTGCKLNLPNVFSVYEIHLYYCCSCLSRLAKFLVLCMRFE